MLPSRFLAAVAITGLVAGAVVSGRQAKSAPEKGKAAPEKAAAAKAGAAPAGPVVVFNFVRGLGSSKKIIGPVEIELYPADAPKAVEHIQELVKNKFYNGLRVHWATAALIQFGDPFSKDLTKKDMWGTGGSGKAIGVDEAKLAKHKFVRGVVGLAYRNGYDPKTADSQLFVIKGANAAADGKYSVVGHVVAGQDVIDKLEVADRIETATMK
jgi:cyclophilin family peptidyl-prolyl cis-trans isomerase